MTVAGCTSNLVVLESVPLNGTCRIGRGAINGARDLAALLVPRPNVFSVLEPRLVPS